MKMMELLSPRLHQYRKANRKRLAFLFAGLLGLFGIKNSEHSPDVYIHGKDGKIQNKDSHGNDPYPPKG